MAYTYLNRPSSSDIFRAIPLYRPASILRPFAPLPVCTALPSFPLSYVAPTEEGRRRSELATAEAMLAEAMRALDAARAGIGDANRTHTAPVMSGSRVVMPPRRYSPERLRERKSYAFRLFNQRRRELSAARRRVEAARAALNMPTLASIEERAATREAVRISKRASGTPIASALIA